jgi:hypothetical protein
MGANQSQGLWRWFFLLAALEAGAATTVLLAVPREAGGYSLGRGAALAFLMLCMLCAAVWAWKPPGLVTVPAGRHAILWCASLVLAVATALFLLRYLDPERLLQYYQRLSAVLWFVLALSVQALLILLIRRYGLHTDGIMASKGLLRSAGIAFGVLLSALGLVTVTRLGVTPDAAYWGEPGIPILGWQLCIAVLGGLGVLLLSLRFGHSAKLDAMLATAIWLFAVAIWLSVPLQVVQNSFYAPIRPPTGQPFPNSDAGYYDSMAHSLLIGYPYQGEIPSRPLYIAFLTVLHLVAGERYDLIIAGQTLVLALIPVVFYGLGSYLHSRSAGAIAALAAIGREWTSLLVSSETRVSNTKTLLVDLPTLLALLVCCFFAARWLDRKENRSGLIAGGTLGLLLLLRTQAIAVLPIVVLSWLLAFRARQRRRYVQLVAFLAAITLSILPWLVHNYLIGGQLSIDAPFQFRIIASQYQYTGNLDIDNVDLEGKSLLGILTTFAIRDPKFVFGFIANHALATQIGGLLALPLIHTYNGLLADVDLYWVAWDGSLSGSNWLLVVGYLGVIAAGMAAAWHRKRWVGMLPLAFSVGYSATNGIARFSGWRYDLPADWMAYFYFALGTAELMAFLACLFGARGDQLFPVGEDGTSRPARRIEFPVVAALFIVIGMLPWLGEHIAAPRYADAGPPGLATRLSSAAAVQALGISAADIELAAASPNAVLEIGRVLYPRFFTRGNGLASAHPWPAYAPRDFPRLGFLLLNQDRHEMILPARQIPQDFEHAADAIVLGCANADYIEARLVLFPDAGVAHRGASPTDPCP